jgi:hypothetical protein
MSAGTTLRVRSDPRVESKRDAEGWGRLWAWRVTIHKRPAAFEGGWWESAAARRERAQRGQLERSSRPR